MILTFSIVLVACGEEDDDDVNVDVNELTVHLHLNGGSINNDDGFFDVKGDVYSFTVTGTINADVISNYPQPVKPNMVFVRVETANGKNVKDLKQSDLESLKEIDLYVIWACDCSDGNSNHKCDNCDKELTTCIDSNDNHDCDICGAPLSICSDNDNNHKCDVCSETLSECCDNNSDYRCDICDTAIVVLLYTIKNDDTYEVSGYEGIPTNLVIPATYNGNPVTSIGDYAFSSCSSLTSITIANSVTSIGKDAFSYCFSLTSITIPNSITNIENYAFDTCPKLVEVYNLSSLNIEKGSEAHGYVGYYAKDIYTSLDTPSKLSTDSNGYIIYTNGAEKILIGYVGEETALTLPSGITSINDYAFVFCTSLTSVTIPNSVTSIGYVAFAYCDSLTSVTIGNSVTSIGDGAFEGCYKLVEVYNLSSLNIEKGAENNGCAGLYAKDIYTSLDTHSKLSTDSNGYIIYTDEEEKILLGYVGKETALTLPSGITSINDYAFYNCTSLTSILIPSSVTNIGESAFDGCSSLTSVTIGNSVASIGDFAFYNCSSLTSVTIGNSVASIGDYAFYRCSSLTSVTIPDSVKSIGEDAFAWCTSLTSVTIPNSVTSIGDSAFYYCPSLMSVTIPNSVTSIGDSAFSGCDSLTSVTIPNSVTSIGYYAFSGCDSLTSVNINSIEAWCGIAFDGYYANPLYYAKKLYLNGTLVTDLVIPDTVTEIKDFAFYNCSSLSSITIPSSVTSIRECAFTSCPIEYASIPTLAISYIPKSNLKEVVITSGDSIGDWAFAHCDSLTSVTISNSVASIGLAAFVFCDSLTSITFEDTTTWFVTSSSMASIPEDILIDVSNPATNVQYFSIDYVALSWYKNH